MYRPFGLHTHATLGSTTGDNASGNGFYCTWLALGASWALFLDTMPSMKARFEGLGALDTNKQMLALVSALTC